MIPVQMQLKYGFAMSGLSWCNDNTGILVGPVQPKQLEEHFRQTPLLGSLYSTQVYKYIVDTLYNNVTSTCTSAKR